MPKFKIGDRVRVVNPRKTQMRDMNRTFTIRTDEGEWEGEQSWSGEGSDYRHKESALELFEKPTSQGPVRTKTVTIHEIIPGDYGKVRIHPSPMRPVELLNVFVYQGDDDNLDKRQERATELRAAALVLTQLAEALEE